MTDRIDVQSGRLEYSSATGNLDVVIYGDLNVIGNSGSTDVTQGSLQIRDVAVITNFGEFGPQVTSGDNIAGLIVDRGAYSLVKLPDPGDPDNFPTVFIWEIEQDSSGNSLLRSDPAAHPGWQFPSGDPSDPTGGSPDVTLPALTSPAGLTWSEATFAWDLNYDYLAGNDPAPLPSNPRIINVGDPLNDADVTAASTVQWVADKIDEFQFVTLPAEVTLENLANVEDGAPALGNFLAYSGTEWVSTNTVEGSLRLENASGTEFVIIDPVNGITVDNGSSNGITADGNLSITATGTVSIQGSTFPNSPGATGQILSLNGSTIEYSNLTNSITAGSGLTKSGSTVVTLNVGAGQGIVVTTDEVEFDTTFGDARYLGITSVAADSDKLDGQEGAFYQDASNLNAGILPAGRFDDTSHGSRSGGGLHATATPTVAGFMSALDKTNLDLLINNNAEENQEAFSFVAVSGQTTISADKKTDTLNVAQGAGIVLTTNASTDTLTVGLDTTSTRNTDHSSVSITAGLGLTGGGDITTTRSLDVGAGDGINVNANDIAVDSTVVRTSGAQTIAGDKTLSNELTIAKAGTSPHLTISENTGGNTAYIRFDGSAGDQQSIRLEYEAFDGNLLENGYALRIVSDGSPQQPGEVAHLEVEGNIYSDGNRVLTTDDLGSGGGIDADTLDGLNASQFLRSDVSDNKIGNLTFNSDDGISLSATGQITKTSGVWITGGADGASNTASNLTLHSWQGVGFANNISGFTIPQGENAVYINVRNGRLYARGEIFEQGTTLSSKYLGISGTAANSTLLDGQTGAFYRNASNLNSGTLSGALFNDASHGNRGGGSLHSIVSNTTHGFMSSSQKIALDGLIGAEPNQNAFSNIAVVAQSTISADSPTDTLTFSPGSGILMTTNTVTDTITVDLNTTSSRNADHSAIQMTAGLGMTGGGNINASRTFDIGAGTGITVGSTTVSLNTSNSRNVDHNAISINSGTGLTGGGTISATRTLSLDTGDTRNVDHSAISINGSFGLTGGGDLTANRTLSISPGDGLQVTPTDVRVDSTVLRTSGNQSLTGVKTFTGDGDGIEWSRNTDFASIKFYNDSDADTNSRLEFAVGDNGNEDFVFVGDLQELLRMSPDGGQTGIKFRGNNVWHAGNDGAGSGLDADLLDGQQGSFYQSASNLNAGTLPSARFNDSSHGNRSGGSLHAAATTSVSGFMSASDKSKLDGISASADVNQNAFSNFAVSGQTTVSADNPTDTLTLVAGTGISLSTNATTDSITITNTGGAGTFVDLTTDQTVGGIKTYTSQSRFSGGSGAAPGVSFSTATDAGLYYSSGALRVSYAGAQIAAFGSFGAFFESDVTIDNGTTTSVRINSDSGGESVLNLAPNDSSSQGSGRLFVGQSNATGGGIMYNGDGTPAFGDIPTDYVTLFRVVSGVPSWTARNFPSNNNWEFRGQVLISDGTAASPGLQFASQPGMGIYESFGSMGFTTAGSVKLGINSSNLILYSDLALNGNKISASASTASAPPIQVGSTGNGLYSESGSLDVVRIASNGTEVASFANVGGTPGTTFITIPQIATTSSAANMVISGLGDVARSTSSKRYKTDIHVIDDAIVDKFLNLDSITYRSTIEGDDETVRHLGFIAEDLDELGLPELVVYNTDGQPESVAYERVTVVLADLAKKQKSKIEQLESELEKIKKHLGLS